VAPGQLGKLDPRDADIVEIAVVEPMELVQRARLSTFIASVSNKTGTGRHWVPQRPGGSATAGAAIPSLI
jgi:hypothetical protein